MAIDEVIRAAQIEDALRHALQRQGVDKVADLDLTRLAVDIEAVIGMGVTHPLDPEGDGLKPSEINAANDV